MELVEADSTVSRPSSTKATGVFALFTEGEREESTVVGLRLELSCDKYADRSVGAISRMLSRSGTVAIGTIAESVGESEANKSKSGSSKSWQSRLITLSKHAAR